MSFIRSWFVSQHIGVSSLYGIIGVICIVDRHCGCNQHQFPVKHMVNEVDHMGNQDKVPRPQGRPIRCASNNPLNSSYVSANKKHPYNAEYSIFWIPWSLEQGAEHTVRRFLVQRGFCAIYLAVIIQALWRRKTKRGKLTRWRAMGAMMLPTCLGITSIFL